MLAEVRVGPLLAADGSVQPARSDRTGATVVTDAHARFQEAVARGNVYLAANQAGAAVTNLNATATGFILTNPAASGKILVLLEVGFAQTSAAATAVNTLQLAANINPVAATVVHTTPLIVRNAFLSAGGTGAGLADSSATLPAAPVAVMNLWSPSVSATATTGIPPVVIVPIEGKIIIGQGCAVSLSALSAISGASHMIWEEIPVF